MLQHEVPENFATCEISQVANFRSAIVLTVFSCTMHYFVIL